MGKSSASLRRWAGTRAPPLQPIRVISKRRGPSPLAEDPEGSHDPEAGHQERCVAARVAASEGNLLLCFVASRLGQVVQLQ